MYSTVKITVKQSAIVVGKKTGLNQMEDTGIKELEGNSLLC